MEIFFNVYLYNTNMDSETRQKIIGVAFAVLMVTSMVGYGFSSLL